MLSAECSNQGKENFSGPEASRLQQVVSLSRSFIFTPAHSFVEC